MDYWKRQTKYVSALKEDPSIDRLGGGMTRLLRLWLKSVDYSGYGKTQMGNGQRSLHSSKKGSKGRGS
jgi:hypothetical protein